LEADDIKSSAIALLQKEDKGIRVADGVILAQWLARNVKSDVLLGNQTIGQREGILRTVGVGPGGSCGTNGQRIKRFHYFTKKCALYKSKVIISLDGGS